MSEVSLVLHKRGWWGDASYIVRHGSTLGLANLGAFSIVFTDSVMIAWLGREEFIGVSFGVLVYAVLLQFGLGCSYIVAPQISEAIGRNLEYRSRATTRETLQLSLIYSVLATPLIYFGYIPLMAFLDQFVFAGHTATYLSIVCLAIVPQMLFVVVGENCVGHGKSQIVLLGTAFAVSSNFILNYLLIFKFDYGVAGVAASTVLTSVFSLLFVAGLSRKLLSLGGSLAGQGPLRRAIRSRLIRLALPLGFLEVLLFFLFAQTTVLVGITDASFLPAHLIVFQITEGVVLVFFGFGEALATKIAFYKGKGNLADIARLINLSYVISAFLGFVCAIVLFTFSDLIFDLYARGKDEFADAGAKFHDLIGLGILLVVVQSFQVMLISALRGFGDTRYSTIVSVLSLGLIGLGGGALSAHFFGGGAFSVWICLNVATLLIAGLCLYRLDSVFSRFRSRKSAPVHK
ncbi:MATE family efflux transporter [Roseibium sp. ROS1]